MARKLITDEVWAILEPLLTAAKGRHGKDDRNFLEAVGWVVRTGKPWRDIPKEFGPWKTVYAKFS